MLATVVIIFALVALLWRELSNVYKTFEQIGVKGPKPTFLVGNLLEIYRRPTGKTKEQVFLDWVSEYGPVFGYFEGVYPVLFVAHPDTLQQILQTDFNNFVNKPLRDDFEGGTRGDLFTSRGQTWKRIRSVLSPVFSMAHMRQVAPVIEDIVQHLINKLGQMSLQAAEGGRIGDERGEEEGEGREAKTTAVANEEGKDGKQMSDTGIDIYSMYQRLTLDIIAQTAFGMNIDAITDNSHPFAYHCKEMFISISKLELPFQIIRGIPMKLRRAIQKSMTFLGKLLARRKDHSVHFKFLIDASKKVVMDRQDNPVFFADKPDLLGLMLERAANEEMNPEFETKDHFKGNFKKTLTLKEVQMNCWIFLLAGFETSSTALGYITHALCHHPVIQEQLAAEIRYYEEREEGKGEQFSFDTIHKMALVDQVIQEALRLYPPAPAVIRRQTADHIQLKVPQGYIQVPKGMTIQIGVIATHFNSNLWPQPEKFDPSRWAPEARRHLHPFQFLPFGLGPRGCVGMRFAITEIKIALVQLIRKFRIEPCSKTETNIEFAEGATRTPKNGVWVNLRPRED